MVRITRIGCFFATFLFVGIGTYSCSTAPSHPSLTNAELPKVILHRDFFMNQDDKFGFSISPDGKKLAWFEVKGKAKPFLFFKTIGEDDEEIVHLRPMGRLSNLMWSRDNQHIFFYQDANKTESYHIFCVDTKHPNKYPVSLTPGEKTKAKIIRTVESDPNYIIIAHNRRSAGDFDLYRINLKTQEEKLLAENSGDISEWIVDDEGRLSACIKKYDENNFSLNVIDQKQKDWRKVISWNDNDFVRVIDFSKDKKGLWLRSNRNREHIAIVLLELGTGAENLFYEDGEIDLDGVLFDRKLKMPIAAETNPGYQKIHFFDTDLEKAYHAFTQEGEFGFNVGSSDLRGKISVVSIFNEKGKKYFLFNSNTGEKELLVGSKILKYKDSLSSTKPISFKSRDGLQIHGYLTIPKGTKGKNLPTVLHVHGGPWSRDKWRYNPMVQFLANRGYAVLQVNYRGSSGYGHNFLEAGAGEWAGKMHDDLVDGVNWAIKEGVTDPQKVGIMGGSYGGYAALVGLTFTPDIFACGISLFGPSNLITLLESAPEYWKHGTAFRNRYVGNPNTPVGRQALKDKSPLFYVNRMKSPLLIVQGGSDVRVRQQESDLIVKSMRENDKEVNYIYFEKEGHGIGRWSNMLYFLGQLEDFLAKHLGGRNAVMGY